jgi:hypothetical protein
MTKLRALVVAPFACVHQAPFNGGCGSIGIGIGIAIDTDTDFDLDAIVCRS